MFGTWEELHREGLLSAVWIFKGIVVNFFVRVIIFCCFLSSRSVAPNKNSGLDS